MPSDEVVEQIRTRIEIDSLISEYVKLTRAGKNLKGLCPFHPEKTPSFNVMPQIQRYHCFGCGASGDIFTFLQNIENLSFKEALVRLAERAKIDLPAKTTKSGVSSDEKEEWYETMSLAAEFYQEALQKHKEVAEYLEGRGISPSSAQKYLLGYAPDTWDALSSYMAKRKKLPFAQKMGLIDMGQDGYYDRFRGRLMIPIIDPQGRVIAFGGRAMGDSEPKYLNSPETPLFQKRQTLYGLNFARTTLLKQRLVLLMEGYFDVITAQIHGFNNAVATLGTSLSDDHTALIKRWADKVIICYDGDNAGINAAIRASEPLMKAGLNVRVAYLPPGEDPDTVLRKSGADALQQAINQAQMLTAFRLKLLLEQSDLKSPEGIAEMFSKAVEVIAVLNSAVERDRYIQMLAPHAPAYHNDPAYAERAIRADVNQAIRRLRNNIQQNSAGNSPSASKKIIKTEISAAQLKAEETLIVAAVSNEWREHIWDWVDPNHFDHPTHKRIAEAMRETWGDTAPKVDPAQFVADIDNEEVRIEIGAILSKVADSISDRWLADCILYLSKKQLKLEMAFWRKKAENPESSDAQRQFAQLVIEAQKK